MPRFGRSYLQLKVVSRRQFQSNVKSEDENLFLDTSALVKRYHQEVGTDVIDKIFREEDKELFISDLSIIEFHSAIALKVRTREISRDAFSHLIGLFSNELDVGLYRVMRIDEAEKQEAVELLTKYGFDYALRTIVG